MIIIDENKEIFLIHIYCIGLLKSIDLMTLYKQIALNTQNALKVLINTRTYMHIIYTTSFRYLRTFAIFILLINRRNRNE